MSVAATKAGDDTYAETTATYNFTSEKAVPSVGDVTCTASIHPGTDPATVTLTHSGTIGGTLKLAEGTAFTLGTKDYDWVFTPTDTANYTAATGKVSLTVTQAALLGIAVTTPPTKTSYTFGETFDPAGMVVTAAYEDGTTAVVTPTFNNILAVDQTNLELSYTEDGVSKSCTLTGLTVNKKAIAALSAEDSARYNDTSAHSFDFSGLLPADCGEVTGVTVSSVAASEILASATGDKDTKTVAWVLKYGLTAEEKSETIAVTVSTANYADMAINLKIIATAKTPVSITGVTAQNGTYNGKAHVGYTGTPVAAGYSGEFTVTYSGRSAPVSAGSYSVTIAVPESDADYTGSVTLSFQVEQATVTVKAGDKTATVGQAKPELTTTVTGLADGEALKTQPTLSCEADMSTAGSYEITASGAAVPDGGNY